jgi:ATP adenylyltransferase
MERLWAPWRHAYVTGASGDVIPDCIFCDMSSGRVRLQPDAARDELLLVRGRVSFVVLNKFPYNNGHLMVVPNRHAPNLATLSADEQAELMRLTRHAEIALTEAYAPHGINVGINLGKSAGAGVLDHLHVHLVPRWNGDTNFMTAISDTRVLPEDLRASALKLRPIFERLADEEKTAERAKNAEKI